MRRLLWLAVLAAAVPALTPAVGATPGDALLAAPLDTSLAPPPPAGALPGAPAAAGLAGGAIAGGEVSTVFGSSGLHGSEVQLDSGLIAGTTRASVAVGTLQGPSWHDAPKVSSQGAAIGVETALPHGITVGLQAGYAHDRLRLPGDAAAAPGADRPGP